MHYALSAGTLALLAWATAWVWAIVPDWWAGRPPAFPGQYAARLYTGLTTLGLAGGTLVARNGDDPRGFAALPRWRRATAWSLIAVGMIGTALKIWHDHGA